MLMMDRITEISADRGEHGKGHVVAEFDIRPDLWFFDCHFPGNPVMPGLPRPRRALAADRVQPRLARLAGRGYALGVGEVKLTGMVRPDRRLLTYRRLHQGVIDRKLKMGVANGRSRRTAR
jgi:3-hydroxyacyl-[acyl-carrier protein] dehydratase / trans-2-decenoyl-[acyl-carrier protein] isomerase